jgi:uncharacterized protein
MKVYKRRDFCITLSGLLLSAGTRVQATTSAGTSQRYWSAASNREDQHFLVGFEQQGSSFIAFAKHALPERGHHVAVNSARGFLVSIARRPGTTLVMVDLASGELISQLTVPADRHLYGHGVFSADGAYFYTTENAFDDQSENSGRLVTWAVQSSGKTASLQRITDTPTGGVGPHELLLLPDGEALAIANGGIRTHPSHDRDILNLDTMLPSLSYVDRHSGKVLEQRFLPSEFHQCSIRHLDVNAANKVIVAMQFEGEVYMAVPLLATHQRGQELRLLQAPADMQAQLHQYVGAVRFAADGRFAAATCPRGNLFTVWDTETATLVQHIRARDNCGVHATTKGFLFSTGLGKVAELELVTGTITELPAAEELALLWDNHICNGGAVG